MNLAGDLAFGGLIPVRSEINLNATHVFNDPTLGEAM